MEGSMSVGSGYSFGGPYTGGVAVVEPMAMSLLDSRNGSTESMRAAQAYPPYAQQQASRQVAERPELGPRVVPPSQVVVNAGVSQQESPGPRSRVLSAETAPAEKRYMTQRDLDERMQEQRVVLQRYVQESQTLQAQRLEDFVEQAITRALRGESALAASTDEHLAGLKADLVELRVALE
ncbi:unnamed protein product, partial [Prorocentrum cordatum]